MSPAAWLAWTGLTLLALSCDIAAPNLTLPLGWRTRRSLWRPRLWQTLAVGSYLGQLFNDALRVMSKHQNATPTHLLSSTYEVAFLHLKDHPFSAGHSSWYTQGTQAKKDRNKHNVLQHLTLLTVSWRFYSNFALTKCTTCPQKNDEWKVISKKISNADTRPSHFL